MEKIVEHSNIQQMHFKLPNSFHMTAPKEENNQT